MTIKTFIILVVIVAITLGATFFFRGGSTKPAPTGDSAGLIVGRNAIYVAEQSPSKTVSVAVARFEKPGFVVIYEDNAGPLSAEGFGPLRHSSSPLRHSSSEASEASEASKPGKILGASGVLQAGDTKNLTPITLSRATADGETLYAMLHLDDGNGVFNPAKDKPALDFLGGSPVMMIFTVSMDANEPGAVSL